MDQSFNKNIFGIHGGGCIGLGLMADIIAKSPHHFEILATSNKAWLCDLINRNHQYDLQHGTDQYNVTAIHRIKMISRNREDLFMLYMSAKFLAICLTPDAFLASCHDIAAALLHRYRKTSEKLPILILMNLPNQKNFVSQHLLEELLALTHSKYQALRILNRVELIPTVVDRIVTPISIDKINKQLSEDSRFNLFNAEKYFAFYVPDTFNEAKYFPDMKQTAYLSQLETLKNKLINGPHAMIAWAGAILGLKTIAETIAKPYIRRFIKNVMINEIHPVLRVACPNITEHELQFFEQFFFKRCAASVNDPVKRVARDPLRKLNIDGNIRGTIELCKKYKLRLSTKGLEKGIALGILYALSGIDPMNGECQKITEIYRKYHSYAAILSYRRHAKNKNITENRIDEDKKLINNVINNIYHLRYSLKKKDLPNGLSA